LHVRPAEGRSVGSVHALRDRIDLVLDRRVERIDEVEGGLLVGRGRHDLGQRAPAPAETSTRPSARRELLTKPRRALGAVVVGRGAAALAEIVTAAADEKTTFDFVYPLDATIEDKIDAIAKRVYGADGTFLQPAARAKVKEFNKLGYDRMPICMAKTHLSLSMTRSWRTRRWGSRSASATSGPTPAPGGSWPSAATCKPCPATARRRRP